MPAAVLQFVYIGPQNVYLTQNPQITFFKTVYKRHTDFSIDTVQEFFDGKIEFGKQIKCKLSKQGDLLHRIGVYVQLSKLFHKNSVEEKQCINCLCTCPKCMFQKRSDDTVYGWANSIGHVILEIVDVYIGGKLIDRHYGEWLEIWSELSQTSEKRHGYFEMIGKKDSLSYTVDSFTDKMELYVPLNFWFCRNIGLSLPVINIPYNEVEICIKLRDLNRCYVCNKPNAEPPTASVYSHLIVDYIYLSVRERQKFFNESHMYLIEQLQLNDNNHFDSSKTDLNINLSFNHPVKELIWIVQREDVIEEPDGVWEDDCSYPKGNDHFNFTPLKIPRTGSSSESFLSAKLQVYGVDRTDLWPASYYRLWQNYYHHTRIPSSNNIYTYSFALAPEDIQPTGQINMSQCEKVRLCIKFDKKCKEKYNINVKVYAINYQQLIITGGMASVMFIN